MLISCGWNNCCTDRRHLKMEHLLLALDGLLPALPLRCCETLASSSDSTRPSEKAEVESKVVFLRSAHAENRSSSPQPSSLSVWTWAEHHVTEKQPLHSGTYLTVLRCTLDGTLELFMQQSSARLVSELPTSEELHKVRRATSEPEQSPPSPFWTNLWFIWGQSGS